MFPRYRNHGGGGNNVAHDPKHNVSTQKKNYGTRSESQSLTTQ